MPITKRFASESFVNTEINNVLKVVGLNNFEPMDDDIPKVFFVGDMPTTKDDVLAEMTYISKTLTFHSYINIKCQGTSSMKYPKKNYTINLFEDAERTTKLKKDFKGWGKQSKFCLKANWIDISHSRNIISARLWGDVVKSRSNYEELPELLRTAPNQGAIDGFFIKVYYNGVYQGRYTWNIPKDKWMTNMDDSLDNHCILCGENYDGGCFRAAPIIDGSDWSDEVHDVVPASIKTRWIEVVNFVMNSSDEEFKTNLGNYFDVQSLIDYHIFGMRCCGSDSYGKNQIYMTYDGNKWIASMYDLDTTWGMYWNGETLVSYDYAREKFEDMINERQGNLLYKRLEENFYVELQTRWAELKNNALSLTNIINRFERFTDIMTSDLIKEDYASTTTGGNYSTIPSVARNNIQQIRNFAASRQSWTDDYFNSLTPIVRIPCTSLTLSATELVFTEAGTQTLTATVEPSDTTDKVVWTSNDTFIATVNKGVVTAVYNGSTTITATCGDFTVTCSVTISGVEEPTDPPADETLLYS
ncbi:MAG: CotH kinase family protein, partial [Erysipelotrichaceae bacterium]|nr:CotH kinase family protein [Erysipelotrichaceae bacterium]